MAAVFVIINAWKAGFLVRIELPLYPPGMAKPAANVAVDISAATIKWDSWDFSVSVIRLLCSF